jgi:hypothetical protein
MIAEGRPRISRRILAWAVAGAVLLAFALSGKTTTDSDLWGHLRFGLDVLHSHQLPSSDPYSFTQDRPWVNHEWLSELQMGVAYSIAGQPGLSLLKGVLVFGTLVVIWMGLRGTAFVPRMITVVIAAASLVPLFRTLRPQLWTCLAVAILCRVLTARRWRMIWWLPPLFGVWANLHGGWVVGLGVLGMWAAVDVALKPSGVMRWAAVVGACTVATLCTPYGIGLWTFLASTVRMNRNITEWQPLWTSPPDWVPWLVVVGGAVWILRRPHPLRPHVVLTLAFLAYAAARVMRLGPLFEECAAVLAAPMIASRFPAAVAQAPQASRHDAIGAAVIFAACVTSAIWIVGTSWPCVSVEGSWVPDRAAAELLDSAGPGRLVVFFDWGEYAIWHWGPRLRVSMDGRRETIYSDTRLAEHQAILSGTATGLATLEAWRPEYVWLPATSRATKRWLAAHGYRIELDDSHSFVAVRADLPRLETTRTPRSPDVRACFPG